MRRFGKTLGEGARRFCCWDKHALVTHEQLFWSAVLDCLRRGWESLSGTSSEDRLWDLTRVPVARAEGVLEICSATPDLHLDLDDHGKHHEHFVPATLVVQEWPRFCRKSLIMLLQTDRANPRASSYACTILVGIALCCVARLSSRTQRYAMVQFLMACQSFRLL